MKPDRSDQVSSELADLERRRSSHRRWFNSKRPKTIGNVIAQVVQRRGYAQVRAAGERDDAWLAAVGAELAKSTRLGAVRRGVVEIFVANSLLMQELTFRKEELVACLQEAMPETDVRQIKFRVGQVS